jgi:hypothetical protein
MVTQAADFVTSLRYAPSHQKYKQACIISVMGDIDDSLDDLGRFSAELDEARRQVRERVRDRDAAMVTALEAGASIGELARASALTPARVGQLLGHPSGRPGRPSADRPPAPR